MISFLLNQHSMLAQNSKKIDFCIVKLLVFGLLATQIQSLKPSSLSPTSPQCSNYWLTNSNHENFGITSENLTKNKDDFLVLYPDLCQESVSICIDPMINIKHLYKPINIIRDFLF